MEEKIFDVGIIGGGPAGYTCALNYAKQGKSVILFEKDFIGGVCLNRGCIPTKSILHSSEIYKNIRNSSNFGITVGDINLDYKKVIDKKNSTVEILRKGILLALKNAKVQIITSKAEIVDKKTIEDSEKNKYNCKKIICATGSSPRIIKGLEFDHESILSSDDILNLDSLPKSILIVGSGAIGIEWARIMSNLGVETTVVELAEHLLPLADIDISKRLERNFKSSKIKFYLNTSVKNIEKGVVALSNDEVISVDKILVAVGRTINNSEKIDGVEYIGDVAGEIQLAHYAIKQAFEFTDNRLFKKDLVPSVVYGNPEVAWVGKREQDLEPDTYKKSTVLLSSLGKAQCDSATDGVIKILSQNGLIVGVHIISPEASSLVQQILIAIQNDIPIEKLKEICFPHPTYSEGIFDCINSL